MWIPPAGLERRLVCVEAQPDARGLRALLTVGDEDAEQSRLVSGNRGR